MSEEKKIPTAYDLQTGTYYYAPLPADHWREPVDKNWFIFLKTFYNDFTTNPFYLAKNNIPVINGLPNVDVARRRA